MKGKRCFPGFRVMIGCFIYMFFVVGFNSIKTIAIAKFPEYYGCSLSTIATFQSGAVVFAGVLALFTLSKLMQTLKPKRLMILGGVLELVYGLLVVFMPNLTGYALASIVNGIVSGVCFYAPPTALLTAWFHEKREFLIGINLAFSTVGVAFWQYLSGKLIVSVGVGKMYLISGTAVCTAVLLSSFLITDDPEEVGEKPYGVQSSDVGEEHVSIYHRVSVKDFLKQRGAVLVLAAAMIGDTNVMFVSLYSTTYLPMYGLKFSKAASFVALLTLVASSYMFISGYVMEKLKLKGFVILVFGSGMLANLMMAVYPDRRATLTLILIGIGYTLGYSSTNLSNYIAAPLFGHEFAITANSMMLGAASLGDALLLFLSARISEATSMQMLYLVLAGISFVTMILYLIANSMLVKKQKEGKKNG